MNKNGPSINNLKNPVALLAFGFGAGLAPYMPGTIGTLVGVLIYLPLQHLPLPYYLGVVLLLCLAGIWICGRTAAAMGTHDHPAIVWDEIAGYLLTMAAAPQGWAWIMLGFLLFRGFDIAKPWPIRWLDERVKGGIGIMADDLLAAVFGLIVMQFIAYIL